MIAPCKTLLTLSRVPVILGLVLVLTGAFSLLQADDCPDGWITTKVKTRLFGNNGFGAFKVDVDTDACVVTLTGCVNSPEQRTKAVQSAAKVSKVRSVRNNLKICPSEKADSEKEKTSEGVDNCADALITSEVKMILMGHEGLVAFKINVDTDSCVVTLRGCVETSSQAREAVRLARKAKGVRNVKNQLTTCSG